MPAETAKNQAAPHVLHRIRREAANGTSPHLHRYSRSPERRGDTGEIIMGRGRLLWLIGIPLPIILLIWVFGGLHG
jgi:hypothetical protein